PGRPGRGQDVAAAVERHRVDDIGVHDRVDLHAEVVEVPQPDGGVEAGAGQEVPVRTEHHRLHVAVVGVDRQRHRRRVEHGEVPDQDPAVVAGGGEPTAV